MLMGTPGRDGRGERIERGGGARISSSDSCGDSTPLPLYFPVVRSRPTCLRRRAHRRRAPAAVGSCGPIEGTLRTRHARHSVRYGRHMHRGAATTGDEAVRATGGYVYSRRS